jgi:hypothetical protein
MKFRIDFKDPDAIALHRLAKDCLFEDKDEGWHEAFGNLSSEQRKDILDEVKESIRDFLSQWMRYGEYVTVEFNMDTKTAMVVPCISQ